MHGLSVGLINTFHHVVTGGNTILRMAAAHGDVQVRHALFFFFEQIVLAGCVLTFDNCVNKNFLFCHSFDISSGFQRIDAVISNAAFDALDVRAAPFAALQAEICGLWRHGDFGFFAKQLFWGQFLTISMDV